MKKCIECKVIEVVNGYLIQREVDSKIDPFTNELIGHKTVFYTVNTPDDLLESFKTVAEAKRFAKSLPECTLSNT